MNEQLQTALAAILNRAVQGLDTSVSFLSGQLPDVIHQLLVWKFVGSIVMLGISGAIATAMVMISMRLYRRAKAEELRLQTLKATAREYVATYDWFAAGLGIALSLGVSGVSLVAFILNVFRALEIWVAPKIYLIEYAASLAKGN